MKAIRVNADYEMALFDKKEAPKIINQSLEFLALYLEESPLFTTRNYSPEFIKHITEVTGHAPQTVSAGEFENWWGPLTNIPLEQKLNSKELSSSFYKDSQVISHSNEANLRENQVHLAKSAFGMSGQNFLKFKKGEEGKLDALLLKAKRVVIEPFFERKQDFSHYVLPSGKIICYENLVDKEFQYKGTLFSDLNHPDVSHLRFYDEIDKADWANFNHELNQIKELYSKEGASEGYSIDSFTYVEDGKLKIRALSEVNYRKTMGLMAWLLSGKFSGNNSWSLLVLVKCSKHDDLFSFIKERIRPIAWRPNTKSGCLQLSPGDGRFEIFFLSAESSRKGENLLRELKELLPDCQFSVQI